MMKNYHSMLRRCAKLTSFQDGLKKVICCYPFEETELKVFNN